MNFTYENWIGVLMMVVPAVVAFVKALGWIVNDNEFSGRRDIVLGAIYVVFLALWCFAAGYLVAM